MSALPAKIAILGGTFDPVHAGHLAVARAALEAGMDRVVWVPAAASPFKQSRPPAAALDRWAMLALATLPEASYQVSRVELDRPPPSYSIETVAALRAEIGTDSAQFWWIVGADHLAEITRWHRIDELAQLVRFFVVPRSELCGQALEKACGRLPEALRMAVDILPMPVVPVSSTEIRQRLEAGAGPLEGVPEAVRSYIARFGLYRTAAAAPEGTRSEVPPRSLAEVETQVRDYLDRELPAKRRGHILGVASMAGELAERFGADPQKARLAGLLHDIVRLWPPDRLLAACRERQLEVTPFDRLHPIVRLHGLLGAHLAQEWFGVTDEDIKAAIASHTLGRPHMSLLEQILYVADYCEPGRGSHAEDVRLAARSSLSAALRLAMDRTLEHLLEKGQAIHPQAVEARNALFTSDKAVAN